jgi:hypothetical protein
MHRGDSRQRVAQLEAEIAELRARLPKHSVPLAMLIQLEELEDELTTLLARPDNAESARTMK